MTAAIAAGFLFVVAAARAERVEDLTPTGYVNDFAGVLDSQTKEQLAKICVELDERAHAQLAVVTIRSLGGTTVEEFANKLFTQWAIGYQGENRGALILLATDDRRYRVEVGYGLEPILTDGKVGGFARQMVPLLRQGDYNRAALNLTSDVAEVIARDRHVALASLPSERSHPESSSSGPGWAIVVLIILTLLLFGGLATLLPLILRGRGGPLGGARWGWGGPGIGPGGWSGGGSFGGFGGGGSFGGFGGGLSGGGGASGSW